MTSDLDLLEKFARANSQDAFTEIVRRHVDLVYSAALRQVRSPHLAEEVAQSVFADLARNAMKLCRTRREERVWERLVTSSPTDEIDIQPANSLCPWLYTVTRRTAIDVLRKESRRQLREQIAVELNNMNATSGDWAQIEPLLDDAMAALDEADRSAVLLRYFENKSLREVGETLGASEDAAQKRVSRAVERLREFFSKRNVTVGAGGLAVLISANAVQSAPVGMAAAISTAAALAGTTVSSSTAVAATKVIAMTTLQKSIIGAVLIAAVGTGIYGVHQASQIRDRNHVLQQQQLSLADQLRQLQQERDEATNQLAGLLSQDRLLQSSSNEDELLKLRAEVTRLQANAHMENDPENQTAKSWLNRVEQLKQWAEQNPGATIPEFGRFLDDQDWLDATRSPLTTKADYRRAMSNLRNRAEENFASELSIALHRYLKANHGEFPTDLNQLQSYSDSPVAEAILKRWEIVPAKNVANIGVGGPNIITQKEAVDDLVDQRFVIGPHGTGSTDFLGTEIGDALAPVFKAFSAANKGQAPANFSQLTPYASTPEQQAAIQKMIEQQQLKSAP